MTPILQENKIDVIKSFFNEIEAKNTFLNETTPYASVDILDHSNNPSCESIQGVCGNVTYHVENTQEFIKLPPSNDNIRKISTISFLNQLSDGQFGKVLSYKLYF
jgi:hypothetical protein